MRSEAIGDPFHEEVSAGTLPAVAALRSAFERQGAGISVGGQPKLAKEPLGEVVQAVAGRRQPSRARGAEVAPSAVFAQAHPVGDDRVESAAASATSEHAGVFGACGNFVAVDAAVVLGAEVEFWVVRQHPAGLGSPVLLGRQAEMVVGRPIDGVAILRPESIVKLGLCYRRERCHWNHSS